MADAALVVSLAPTAGTGSAAPTVAIHGVDLDDQTRCRHYHSAVDIIAIKMMCCGIYHACADCHAALADHPITVWPVEQWQSDAVLCGNCRHEITIAAYMACGNRCPNCGAGFNPRCRDHYHLYFGVAPPV